MLNNLKSQNIFLMSLMTTSLTIPTSFGNTDSNAELEKVAAYLGAGMACVKIVEQTDDLAMKQKFEALVNSLVDKTFFYTSEEQEQIRLMSVEKSKAISAQEDIAMKCTKLAESL